MHDDRSVKNRAYRTTFKHGGRSYLLTRLPDGWWSVTNQDGIVWAEKFATCCGAKAMITGKLESQWELE